MTRINGGIPPVRLFDLHLIAEIKEVNQLAGQFKNSFYSKKGIDLSKVPSEFKLSTGHVYFFYNKGKYLCERHKLLCDEAINRGYNIQTVFQDEWSGKDINLYNSWEPKEEDNLVIKQRILQRYYQKPWLYKYYGEPVGEEQLIYYRS